MSDLNLIDVVNLIRAEIARTEIGDVKRITGPQGERGPQGEQGIQGPQGPRGNDGARGPAGAKGNQGKKGDKGVKGDDGADGVGIARVEQDIDNAIVVHLTDGNFYTIEMPLINPDGSLAKEVHYKSGGSGGDGGSGTVDLSGYVRRPSSDLKDSWLVYKEGSDGSKLWTPVTTDLVAVNPNPFRNTKGQFAATPEELENLKNQRDVNEFLYDAIQKVEAGDINLDGYATEDWVTEQIDGIDFPAGTIVSNTAPLDVEDGATWYDTVRLELFVYAMGAWLPCSPLGARVEQGEILQAQILSRVEAGEVQQQTLVDTTLGKAEANEVANSFRIKGEGGTYISASGGELGLYHVKYPEAETHAATMGYVDDEIAKVSGGAYPTATRPFNIKTDRTFINLRAGELILTNHQGSAVSVISDANALAFHAVDADGNRVVPDANAIEYACRLAAAIQLFNHDITSQILRISQTGQSGGYVDFSYMKDADTFCLGWVSPGILTKTSEMDRLVDDQRVHVRVPDLIV